MKLNYTYEMPEGTVYVHIRPADQRSYRTDRDTVTEEVPCIEVATRQLYSEDGQTWLSRDKVPWSYLKVGTHEYRFYEDVRPMNSYERKSYDRSRPGYGWSTRSTPYDGGMARKSETQVEHDNPVKLKVEAIVYAAVNKFAEEVPNWQEISIAMRLLGELSRALGKRADADKARRAADEKVAEAESAYAAYRQRFHVNLDD